MSSSDEYNFATDEEDDCLHDIIVSSKEILKESGILENIFLKHLKAYSAASNENCSAKSLQCMNQNYKPIFSSITSSGVIKSPRCSSSSAKKNAKICHVKSKRRLRTPSKRRRSVERKRLSFEDSEQEEVSPTVFDSYQRDKNFFNPDGSFRGPETIQSSDDCEDIDIMDYDIDMDRQNFFRSKGTAETITRPLLDDKNAALFLSETPKNVPKIDMNNNKDGTPTKSNADGERTIKHLQISPSFFCSEDDAEMFDESENNYKAAYGLDPKTETLKNRIDNEQQSVNQSIEISGKCNKMVANPLEKNTAFMNSIFSEVRPFETGSIDERFLISTKESQTSDSLDVGERKPANNFMSNIMEMIVKRKIISSTKTEQSASKHVQHGKDVDCENDFKMDNQGSSVLANNSTVDDQDTFIVVDDLETPDQNSLNHGDASEMDVQESENSVIGSTAKVKSIALGDDTAYERNPAKEPVARTYTSEEVNQNMATAIDNSNKCISTDKETIRLVEQTKDVEMLTELIQDLSPSEKKSSRGVSQKSEEPIKDDTAQSEEFGIRSNNTDNAKSKCDFSENMSPIRDIHATKLMKFLEILEQRKIRIAKHCDFFCEDKNDLQFIIAFISKLETIISTFPDENKHGETLHFPVFRYSYEASILLLKINKWKTNLEIDLDTLKDCQEKIEQLEQEGKQFLVNKNILPKTVKHLQKFEKRSRIIYQKADDAILLREIKRPTFFQLFYELEQLIKLFLRCLQALKAITVISGTIK